MELYEIVEQGYLINASLVLALLAILNRFVLGIIGDYLLKETENIGVSKSKFSKNYKTKVEQTFLVERDVNDTMAFVEKYIRKQHYLGISIRGYQLMAAELILFAVILNTITCAGALIYGMLPKLTLWSIVVTVLSLLLFSIATTFIDFPYKYAGIKNNMKHYVDNEYKNHCNAAEEAKKELMEKEMKKETKDIKEKEKLPKSLSPAEEKIIQDVLKEFLA